MVKMRNLCQSNAHAESNQKTASTNATPTNVKHLDKDEEVKIISSLVQSEFDDY